MSCSRRDIVDRRFLSWDEVMIGVCIGARNIFLYCSDLPAYSYAVGGTRVRESGGGGGGAFSFMQLHFLNVILY